MTPRAIALVLALIAAACAQVSPEELAEHYEFDRIQADDALPEPTSTEPADDDPAEPEPPSEFDSEPYDVWSTTCPFDGDGLEGEVECGHISLPGPESSPRPIRLSYARFFTDFHSPRADPVIYLHGGPGGSVLADAESFYTSIVDPFIDRRDVVIYDQRGGGESSPLPACEDAWRFDTDFFLEDRDHADVSVEYLDVLAQCGEDLSSSFLYDLQTYNSVTNARDTIELARALGIDSFNIHASSYGTRLAQTILREYPGRVRSAILTGFYPTDVNLIGSVPDSLEMALQTVFDACAADPICDPALPDPWSTLDEAMARFNREPVAYESPYFYDVALIDDDEVINGLHALLYSAGSAAMIPDALIDFRDGNLDKLTRIGASSITDVTDVAGFVAVQCNEEAPFTSEAEATAARATTRSVDRVNLVPGFIGGGLLDLCPFWDTGSAEPVENEPTSWDVPTLMFSGGFDPITPPTWAATTAGRLDSVTHVHFPDRGHDADESFCAVDMMRRFIERPEDEVDVRCMTGDLLVLDNNAARFIDRAAPEFVEDIFDTESGDASTWADIRVPDWEPYYIDDETSYYRGNDWLDPTILVIRNGPFNVGELTWYLEGYSGERFVPTDTPARYAGTWERRLIERTGSDMVAYVHQGEPAITVALAAESDELATLERTVVFAVLDSFAFG